MKEPEKYKIVQVSPQGFVIYGYYNPLVAQKKVFGGWKDLIINDTWEPLDWDLRPRMTYMILGKVRHEYTPEYESPWHKGIYNSLEDAEARIEAKKNPFQPKEIKIINNPH